tara:strand:+ start:757 stop:978 length:222 start_codon:yes stop_codon:yes gene_type:complete
MFTNKGKDMFDWFSKKFDELYNSIDSIFNPKTPNFEELTKLELEEYGRTIGIELDRRKKKANMIKDLREFKGE